MNERLGVVGGGTIATGLAVTAAQHGDVILWARTPEKAQKGIDKLAPKMEVDPAKITVTSDLADLAGATIVVEAIAEELETKRELYAKLPDGDGTLLATTTSSLSVNELDKAANRPGRYFGLHVFNPVPRMKLVELVFPDSATEETKERARALCELLGKTAVEVPDTPGFVVNKLLFPYLFSAVELQEQTGLDSESIDTAMKLGAGHPIGPLALLDLVGLDVSKAIGEEIGAPIPATVEKLVAEGKLGRKSGAGLTL
ncbi:MAG TPA: 3-hydroxyacyl-CoA dehydrogenase family protein [Solirubrobacteraceae bacterium]|nr:3-hydroxyacyl-CoA dehydrogenase family protein [Solirubrobacteraceae bacterium]